LIIVRMRRSEKNSFGGVACQQDTVEAETKANMLSPQMQYHLFPYKPTSNKVTLIKFHTKFRTSFILTVLFYRAQASTVQQQVNYRGD